MRYSLIYIQGGAKRMPNIKSAIKRVSVIEKKTLRNNMIKSGYRTAVRKFEEAVDAKDVNKAETLYAEATKKIDMACTKGVIVKNTASRKKSRLAKKLNAIKA
jgi:small subunit ribosomal protein S20